MKRLWRKAGHAQVGRVEQNITVSDQSGSSDESSSCFHSLSPFLASPDLSGSIAAGAGESSLNQPLRRHVRGGCFPTTRLMPVFAASLSTGGAGMTGLGS